MPYNGRHASNRTLRDSAQPPPGGFPGPPKRPATPHDPSWGPAHGLAAPSLHRPPPAGARPCHIRPPSPRGPADHHWWAAWAA